MPAQTLAEFFDNNTPLKDQSDYAVAVSGGPDSMALTHALLTNYPDKKFHLLTVDHGLRAESATEAQKVGAVFSDHDNATHIILNWEGEKPENAILEEARKARYDLINQYCASHNIQTVFIAHHQDDQAETFLIRLSKGSGLDGLTSMKAVTNQGGIDRARPLLSVPKQDLISYCRKHNVDYVEDPTNDNPNYMRPRLRQSMETLAQEGLTSKRLFVTAKRLRRARDALNFYTKEVFESALIKKEKNKIVLDFEVLSSAPMEISLRILQNLIESQRTEYDYNVRMEKLEDLHHSLMENHKNFKPRTLGGCLISLKRTQLIIEKEEK